MTQPAAKQEEAVSYAREGQLLIGRGQSHQWLNLALANRHGLITGATGTGKTVTLQVLAEGFSRAGVPVFMADVKGDLSGMCQPSSPNPKLEERIHTIGINDYEAAASPVVFWDVFGRQGHPLRTTISEMGPLLLARLMNLSDAQEGVLHIAFKVADDEGMLLLDMKDLRAMLNFLGDHAEELRQYGHISTASVGSIQRRLLELESQGAESFFGEPALDISDLMRTARDGRGMVNILAANELMQSPGLYSTFLLWLLSELFETLPEVGDLEQPKLVFFFDEAHLLFDEAPKALLDKVEQVVRLIRSKGVGVYFITQNPLDVPVDVLGQLGNRVQHALRAFTPKDQKAVKAAAETFRPNPSLDTAAVITEMGVGEALVSVLQKGGVPSMVERVLIAPPQSRIGPATEAERKAVQAKSPVAGMYDDLQDRESAYEILTKRTQQVQAEDATRTREKEQAREEAAAARSSGRQGYVEATAKSILRSVGSSIGREITRQIVRGVLGSLRR